MCDEVVSFPMLLFVAAPHHLRSPPKLGLTSDSLFRAGPASHLTLAAAFTGRQTAKESSKFKKKRKCSGRYEVNQEQNQKSVYLSAWWYP